MPSTPQAATRLVIPVRSEGATVARTTFEATSNRNPLRRSILRLTAGARTALGRSLANRLPHSGCDRSPSFEASIRYNTRGRMHSKA